MSHRTIYTFTNIINGILVKFIQKKRQKRRVENAFNNNYFNYYKLLNEDE